MEQNGIDLARESGLGGGFETYRVVSVDNGIDTAGTNATGEFVIKKFENNQVVRDRFAPSFDGVILVSRAMLKEKDKSPKWKTAEFNPLMKKDLIPIIQLSEGKPVKDADGNFRSYAATFDEIKEKMSYMSPSGTKRTYDYFIILYVLLETNEIIKLMFKGTGRGNFFTYQSTVSKTGNKMNEIVTSFGTMLDPESKKYAVTFDIAKDENGEIRKIESPVLIENNQIKVIEAGKSIIGKFLKNAVALPQANAQVSLPQAEEQPAPPEEIPTIQLDEEEPKKDISIDDVPFK